MANSCTYETASKNDYHSNLLKINVFILSLFFLLCGKLNSQSLSAEQIYEKVKDAVVVILAYDNSDELRAQGSGVVINDKGYVVTNYHVLEGNERLEIMHGEEIIPYVDIIGIDVEKDILILKIEKQKFPSIKNGNTKELKIGQRVYAIGSPLGFENTISEGIVSGLRSYDEVDRNFIQITASISHGSSGGAVVNNKGELIGISTLTVDEGQNLNFAIPIEDVLRVKISSYLNNNEYKSFELFYKGYEAANKGDYEKAEEYFSRFIKKHPNYASAYYNRGKAKYDLEDYNGAIQDYTKAIEINPNFEEAFCNRGNVKRDLENYKDALKDYTRAIDINPHSSVAYNNRGITKTNLEDYRGAVQDFTKAIELNPNYVNAYNNRGNAKRYLEDYRGAIQDYTKTIEIDPNYVGAYYNIGIVKNELEDYRGAINAYNKAIEINPSFAEAYYNRAVSKYNLGDKFGACLDLSKAGELGLDAAYDMIRENCN